MQAWQVREFRAPSIYSSDLSVLGLASSSDRLATVTYSLLGETSAEEAD